MPAITELLESLKSDLAKYIKEEVGHLPEKVASGITKAVEQNKEDLARWLQQYAEGKISKDDLESLIRGARGLGEMEALKQVGLAKVRLDEIQSGIIRIILKNLTERL
ncbi:MAG: hypothetical protein NT025_09625 [bacterium]|nr:hypothetical protein [bacterium]